MLKFMLMCMPLMLSFLVASYAVPAPASSCNLMVNRPPGGGAVFGTCNGSCDGASDCVVSAVAAGGFTYYGCICVVQDGEGNVQSSSPSGDPCSSSLAVGAAGQGSIVCTNALPSGCPLELSCVSGEDNPVPGASNRACTCGVPSSEEVG